MRILVTGGSSFLGSHILKRAPKDWSIAATYFSHPILQENVAAFCVDLREEHAVHHLVAEMQPNFIIHTPAVMNGESLEALNVNGTRAIARASAKTHARLVHISSDVIFDGERAPYNESSEPQPITPYGRSKVRGEQLVREERVNALIIRTSLIYGFVPMDPRTRDILDGRMPRLFTDEIRCPIFVDDLADALIELAANNPVLFEKAGCSVLHIAGPQKLSRFEFGLKLARAYGVEPRFQPAFSASHTAPRPRDVTLDVSTAQRILKTRLRTVDEVLSQVTLSP